MLIEKLTIEGYRSIRNVEITFDRMTSIIGANNSGKSTVLQAINLFFESAPRLSVDDYYNKDAGGSIVLTATFGSLVPQER